MIAETLHGYLIINTTCIGLIYNIINVFIHILIMKYFFSIFPAFGFKCHNVGCINFLLATEQKAELGCLFFVLVVVLIL